MSDIRERAWAAMNTKTKPTGSLGRLEDLAVQLCVLKETLEPKVDASRVVIFAGDHGVTAEGISPYPSSVTAQMVHNFAEGGAAVSVLSRLHHCDLEVVDVGVDYDLPPLPGITHMKVRRATRNMAVEPAMTMEECRTAIVVGTSIADKAAADEIEMIAVGEMGIGNTTAAAALLSSLTGLSPDQTVGMGTAAGLDHRSGTEIMETKKAVITRALALHDHYVENGEPREEEENGDDGDDDADTDPRVQLAFRKLQTFGGLEIAAMVGCIQRAAQHRLVLLIDGFISSVACLAAIAIKPSLPREAIVLAHRSSERGHRVVLEALEKLGVAAPLLDLGMRLGEASGACLAIPIIRSAAHIMTEMATFQSAAVSSVCSKP